MCWDKADIGLYYSLTGQLLQAINVPTHVFTNTSNCESSIERFYNDIVNALVIAGTTSVPIIPHSALKPFWNADLDDLKRQSIDVHELWKSLGKPRSGPINTTRLKIKAEYKCAIKKTAVEYENSHIDESAEYFGHKDKNNFWRSWNAKYNKRVSKDDICINGSTLPIKKLPRSDSSMQAFTLILLMMDTKLLNIINFVYIILVMITLIHV